MILSTSAFIETDLCFIGERPHERLLGLSVDEIDVGNEYFPNTFSYKDGVYKAGVLREVVTLQTAKPLGTYLRMAKEKLTMLLFNQIWNF